MAIHSILPKPPCPICNRPWSHASQYTPRYHCSELVADGITAIGAYLIESARGFTAVVEIQRYWDPELGRTVIRPLRQAVPPKGSRLFVSRIERVHAHCADETVRTSGKPRPTPRPDLSTPGLATS